MLHLKDDTGTDLVMDDGCLVLSKDVDAEDLGYNPAILSLKPHLPNVLRMDSADDLQQCHRVATPTRPIPLLHLTGADR